MYYATAKIRLFRVSGHISCVWKESGHHLLDQEGLGDPSLYVNVLCPISKSLLSRI